MLRCRKCDFLLPASPNGKERSHHVRDLLSAVCQCNHLRLHGKVFNVAGRPLFEIQAEPAMLQARCRQPGKPAACMAPQRRPGLQQATIESASLLWSLYVILKISCSPPRCLNIDAIRTV